MDGYFELALESAESAGTGIVIGERRLSPRLRCLSFVAETSFGEESRGKGRYHTLITEENPAEDPDLEKEIAEGVCRLVKALDRKRKGKILAVGLGNPSAVVDALGCETIKRLTTGKTRRGYLATITPSVFGLTGLETASVVKGVVREFAPDMVLCVDTLATRRAERLFKAVQISDGGIIPGGGVGNRRIPLSEETLGCPVLSVGVPLLAHAERCSSLPDHLIVTPKEIDLLVPAFARALSEGLSEALSE